MSDERQERFAIERLNQLKRAMDDEAPSELARIAVLSEFTRARQRIWSRPGVWAAAAACAIAIASAAYWWQSQPEPPAPVAQVSPPTVPTEAAKSVPAPAPDVIPSRLARVTRLQRARTPQRMPTRRVLPAPVAPPEVATDFFPLPYAPPLDPDEGADVIRVRLPRSAMRTFGLPVSEDRWNERVSADVILGQDGVARAVRFVKLAQQ